MCVGGFAACKLCRHFKGTWQGCRDPLVLGTGSFLKFQSILRHGNATLKQQRKLAEMHGPQNGITSRHELAVEQWCREQSLAFWCLIQVLW